MIILDVKTVLGFIGSGVAFIMPFVESLNFWMAFLAGLGGLVLLALSIIHKIIQIIKDSKNK